MALIFRKLHPLFAAEASEVDLRQVEDRHTLEEIRAAMDEYLVLVFRGQRFSDEQQLAFAQRFDGALHARTGAAVLGRNRFGNEALTDICLPAARRALESAGADSRSIDLVVAATVTPNIGGATIPPGRFGSKNRGLSSLYARAYF